MKQLRQPNRRNWITTLCLMSAAVLYLVHFLHLQADFPNHSPWMDWAKYTDEGWYGDGAIRHYLRGTWRLPGDFNPAVALPVWPLLEALLFRFTGVGIVAARSLTLVVYGGALACSFLLLSLPLTGTTRFQRRAFGACALLLQTVSSFVYAFMRMAIVEPLLITLWLCVLLLAYRVRFTRTPVQRTVHMIGLGVLVALAVATKTTAIFLLPSLLWMLWDSSARQPGRMLRNTALAGGIAALLWATYLAVLLHAGLLEDFRYLFTANQNTGLTRENAWEVVQNVIRDGMWMGTLIYPLSLLAVFVAVFRPRIWRDGVFTSLVLWAAGYMAFLTYHANFQPRYYLVIAVPLMLLLVRAAVHAVLWNRLALFALVPLLGVVIAQELHRTLLFVRHPEYSLQTAARQIEHVVESEPSHSHTVLSISGSTLSLMTGLPSICDDFGTMDLEDRIARYRPGWFVTWNVVEDDKMEALAKFYRLTRVAAFPAMDDPDRNLIIIYRLDPRDGVQPKRRRRGATNQPAKHPPAVDAGERMGYSKNSQTRVYTSAAILSWV